MSAVRTLQWVERLLLTAGIVVAVWCAVVMARAEYYRHLPVPAPPTESRALTRLPGEDESDSRSRFGVVEAGSWVARLDGPSIGLSTTVLEGSDDRTLDRAAGRIEGTAWPGATGNLGIAGHRDTVFRPLRHVKPGDELRLTTIDSVFRYRVTHTLVVDPDDVYVLDAAEAPRLTLVTCYPFTFVGSAPRRFVVQADLVGVKSRG